MSKTKQYLLPILILVLFLIFLRWIITTVMPVLWVETKYQYHQTLTNVFHVPNLKALIVPDFSWLNWEESTKYPEYGIRIPAIFLDEPVVFNTDPNQSKQYTQALKKGIAHASSTAFPDNGGLGYYFAHSASDNLRIQYNAVFYLLGKLEKGDEIFIWHEGSKYEYQVYKKEVTQPQQVSFLYQDYDQETIVLQTCWPAGTTKERLLIFAKRVES
ncbi:MAG: sortase [Candidatus Pacebacteria bacterium]|nr:sortase [Candidatus Paceibacterota bacterium]